MAKFIRRDTQGTVAIVTLARPELHNAFNEVLIDELIQAMAELGRRADIRSIILAADGRSFCAGADVHWMKRMVDYTLDENIADATAMANMLRAIRECPKPVVARVHGAAIGGGVGLAAACDMAIALESAVFCLSEVKLGILPAVISPYVVEKIGPGHMRRYALTAERFTAGEARRMGLVCEVAATPEEMDAWIERITALLAVNGPEALAACKAVLREVQPLDWEAKQRLTVERIAERRVSAEGQEGLKAFLEKRRPDWLP